MKITKSLIVVFILFVPTLAFAGWQGPEKVLEGSWGTNIGEFGISYGDSFDSFPKYFLVDKNNKILIFDVINRRLQIYDNGKFIAIMPKSLPKQFIGEEWPYEGKLVALGDKIIETNNDQIYDYNGNLIGTYDVGVKYFRGQDKDDNLFFEDISTKKFYKYSPTAELLKTYDQKPLALGIEQSSGEISGGLYQQIIEYDNAKFILKTKEGISSYTRDSKGYLYGTAEEQGTSNTYYRVYKFDPCSKQIASLDLPEDIIQEKSEGLGDAPVSIVTVEEGYGPAVIGPDGSVYCWKRTPTTYSILKWTWVDDPSDIQPGPDAPDNLKVIPSTDGLYLSWGASPQDPGCVDGYDVERATSADGIFSNVTTTDKGVLKFDDSGALPGSSYFYKVRAKSDGLYSPYTPVVSGSR